MALLFFEGFNIQNVDETPYLDPRYWTVSEGAPKIESNFSSQGSTHVKDTDVISYGTYRRLCITGYNLSTFPAEFPVPLQLSGVSGLDSDQLYISFRVANLAHNSTYSSIFPHTTKFLTLCSGNKELLSFDIVRTTGLSVQGGVWTAAGNGVSAVNNGLGISVKQTGSNNNMTQIGLFDFRVGGLPDYSIYNLSSSNTDYFPTMILSYRDGYTRYFVERFLHLEFFINTAQKQIRMKIDGFDVVNRASRVGGSPYSPIITGLPFGVFDNLKFYHRGIVLTEYDLPVQSRIIIDDIAICNNSGSLPNTWMGPNTRVLHLNEKASLGINQWNSYGSEPVLDSNDGDTSYISSQTSGDIYGQQMRLSTISHITGYFGQSDIIGGLRLFNVARKTFLDSDFINTYSSGQGLTYDTDGTLDGSDPSKYYNVGDHYQLDLTDYTIKNSFVFKDPISNLPWDTGTFFAFQPGNESIGWVQTSGYFGVKKL